MDKRTAAFARRLCAALDNRGLSGNSDGELAKLLARHHVAVSPQTISNWRNGKHLPKLQQFPGLAAMLRVDPGELAFGKTSSAVAEQRGAWHAASAPDESEIVDGYVLLDESRRALVRELIRLLSQPGKSGKRPGRRKMAATDRKA